MRQLHQKSGRAGNIAAAAATASAAAEIISYLRPVLQFVMILMVNESRHEAVAGFHLILQGLFAELLLYRGENSGDCSFFMFCWLGRSGRIRTCRTAV